MNKKFRKGFVFGLALVFVAAVVMAAIPTHYVTSLFVKNINRLSENHTVQLFNSDTAVVAKGFTISGSVDASNSAVSNFTSTPDIVIIDTLAELNTWSGAAAGASYFQMEAGKTYLVDFEAIRTESKGTTTGVTMIPWSAVSAMAPIANSTTNEMTFTVGIICSGTSGYAPAMAGVTTVQVWPAPLAGATRFGEPSVGNQNMVYHSSSSTPFYVGSSTNTYDVGINYLNESITWRLFNNSAVSAQIVTQTLTQ